jgi:hypothetical protein
MAIDRADTRGDPVVRPNPGQKVPNFAVTNFKATVDADQLGVTLSYVVSSLANVGNIVVLRSFTGSLKDAVAVSSLVRSLGAATYDDRSASVAGQKSSYWISVSTTDTTITVNVGPQIGDLTTSSAIPATPCSFFDVSQSPNTDGTITLTIAIDVIATVQFSGFKVSMSNYQGSGVTSDIAYSSEKQFNIVVSKDGLNHTLQEFIRNAAGVYQVTDILNKVVNLNAVQSAPVRPINLRAVGGADETQISCSVSVDPSVTKYRLYRALAGLGFGSAVKVSDMVKGASDIVLFNDVGQPGLHVWDWWIATVNPSGESTPNGPISPSVIFA